MPTDNELDRSFARTGPGKIETPQDIIEIDILRIDCTRSGLNRRIRSCGGTYISGCVDVLSERPDDQS